MIDRKLLLDDLKALVKRLEADLQERVTAPEVPEVEDTLRSQYDEAKQADRTAQTFNQWVTDQQTQVAVAWVLNATFARFLEDNELVSPARLSGPGEALARSRDEHEAYFRQQPTHTDREYLLWVFGELAKLPGAKEIFGVGNLVWDIPNWLSGDAAGEILAFFQKIDPNTGALVHDFTDGAWDTRFLGDLYQDLSEAARKKYALLQTPSFVEEFILDRTLEPAIAEFGLAELRLIDPACGSGHFLLGAFQRVFDHWLQKEPGTYKEELARRSLMAVHGVDVNPFAVAIARFRLLLAAMQATDQQRLQDARNFPLNLACGDSLLHGEGSQLVLGDWAPMAHHFVSEDIAALNRLLRRGHYHAVVANPPYIVPKDKALNGEYRQRYETCHMKYSLAVPFMERIFQLTVPGGYTGQITANSFMKREFGKKLIEEFFPKVDLTHVIDTSGAYIPGHGTPTVILFGRQRTPISSTIRTVMGIRGEPSTPEDPTQGLVWSAILEQVDVEGSESEFVSVADSQRELFHKHPWSIGGGGASELKEQLDQTSILKLGKIANAIGITAVTGEDELFLQPLAAVARKKIELNRILVQGDTIRDWRIESPIHSIWLYNDDFKLFKLSELPETFKLFWQFKASIYWRKRFGTPLVERGLSWYEWQELYDDKLRTPLSIAFAFVATHNHFVLDRGGKVFKQSAPVIKLPAGATEDDHLALLGLLNSSTACFWMKQVTQIKTQTTGMDPASWRLRREFDGTKLKQLPLTQDKPLDRAKALDGCARKLTTLTPHFCLTHNRGNLSNALQETKQAQIDVFTKMITLQEELDWHCYKLYKLLNNDLTYSEEAPLIQFGQRAFEILMARQMAIGELETEWFEWNGVTPITEPPAHWPEDYKQLVERRIDLIENDKSIGLIEQPEYKRRWETEPWESQLERALQTWLLNRLESYFDLDGRMSVRAKHSGDSATAETESFGPNASPLPDAPPAAVITDPALISTVKLADIARQDPDFMQVGELYTHNPAFDVLTLINTLVEAESVPLLPVLRYKPTGLRKRQDWQHTWHLQRQEDAIDARTQLPKDHPDHLDSTAATRLKADEVGDIPVPPKYKTSDFLKTHYWKLRGKLDVPKERWVSFPHCEGPDGQPVIAWAGYDHLQLALAISTYFVYIKEEVGGNDDPRLIPLLACLIELLPWLQQWHNHLDPTYNLQMGDYIQGFLDDEARQLNLAPETIQSWQPPKKKKGKRRK